MRRNARSPEAYRTEVSGEQRELLEAVRALILEVAPDIEEGVGHGMLDYPGLANLGAQKHHVALYVRPAVLDRHRGAFAHLRPGKSCVRFRRMSQLEPNRVWELLTDVRRSRSDD